MTLFPCFSPHLFSQSQLKHGAYHVLVWRQPSTVKKTDNDMGTIESSNCEADTLFSKHEFPLCQLPQRLDKKGRLCLWRKPSIIFPHQSSMPKHNFDVITHCSCRPAITILFLGEDALQLFSSRLAWLQSPPPPTACIYHISLEKVSFHSCHS